jgi:hypothetical protein
MSKMKISFSFLLTLMLVAMFSIVASAAGNTPSWNPGVGDNSGTGVKDGVQTTDDGLDNGINNANSTGSDVSTNDGSSFNQVIKSDDMVKADGSH